MITLFFDTITSLDFSILNSALLIAVLLFISGLISGSESAFFSLTKLDLENPKPEDASKVQIITSLLEKPKKLIASMLIANNLANIGVVIAFPVIGNVLFNDINSPTIKFLLEVVVVTFFILLFGEVLPKIYASRNRYSFALKVAYTIYTIDVLMSPFSNPMRYLTNLIQNRLKGQKNNLSIDQLSQALDLTSTTDTSHEEQKILRGIVSFGNTDASQVMKPRIDIFSLDIEEKFSEIIPKLMARGFSRIPVYKENIDHVEGILFVKDLIPYIDNQNFDWSTLIRTPIFVPENKKLDDLLKTFQNTKNHLAIVVDEYGGTSGLISLEDIIEEIVGNISDEFDDVSINYTQIDDKNFMFEGKTSLKDFYRVLSINNYTSFEESKGEAETLAGFLLQINKSFPKKGQKISFDDYIFTVDLVDNRRIKQIKVTLKN